MSSPNALPISSDERIPLIDALRGFALWGILVINIKGLSGFAYSLDAFPDWATRFGVGATTIEFLTRFLVEGKFYSIFSFLFGLGFSIQLARGEGKPDWLRMYARRMRILFLIGALHALLLWSGDILWIYALLGFALMLFRNLPAPSILACAVALLLAPIPFFAVYCLIAPGYDTDNLIPNAIDLPTWIQFMSTASIPAALGLNLEDLLFSIKWRILGGRFFKVLGLFLLGLWAGRSRILHEPERHRTLLRRVLWVALALGLTGSFVDAVTPSTFRVLTPQGIFRAATHAFGVHPLAFAYIAIFALLWQRPRGQRILSSFVPMGRMALTNYLMQTVLGVTIYCGYGFGWYGRMPILITMLVIVPLMLLAQMAVSTFWLRHFRFGPAEWIWRQGTYGRRLPLRLRQAPAPGGSSVSSSV